MLNIPNFHSTSCGTPPVLDIATIRYFSYFENSDREQFMFVVSPDRKCLLYAGDVNWNKPIEIEVRPFFENSIVFAAITVSSDIAQVRGIFNTQNKEPLMGFTREADWLITCWDASYWARGEKESSYAC